MSRLSLSAATVFAVVLVWYPTSFARSAGHQAATVVRWQVLASPRTIPQLTSPGGLAIDLRGSGSTKWMYVADSGTSRVIKLGTHGRFLGVWSYGPKPKPYSFWISQTAVGGSGNVFVVDPNHDMVKKFSPSGRLLLQFGTQGAAPGQLNIPRGIALDPHGTIYVADWQNHRIQTFDSGGHPSARWLTPFDVQTGQGESAPVAVTITHTDNIYVGADCAGSTCSAGHADTQDVVLRATPDGRVLQHWLGATPHGGWGPGQQPWVIINAMTSDLKGNWYVAGLMFRVGALSQLQSGVLKYSPTGRRLHQWLLPGTALPSGIAADQLGTIYVSQGTSILTMTQ